MVAFAAFGVISTTAEGLGQRALVATELLWLLVTAGRLRAVATPAADER